MLVKGATDCAIRGRRLINNIALKVNACLGGDAGRRVWDFMGPGMAQIPSHICESYHRRVLWWRNRYQTKASFATRSRSCGVNMLGWEPNKWTRLGSVWIRIDYSDIRYFFPWQGSKLRGAEGQNAPKLSPNAPGLLNPGAKFCYPIQPDICFEA